jgi:hypothetical protein
MHQVTKDTLGEAELESDGGGFYRAEPDAPLRPGASAGNGRRNQSLLQ